KCHTHINVANTTQQGTGRGSERSIRISGAGDKGTLSPCRIVAVQENQPPILGIPMDFDRNAIGSLEDVHREWDSLDAERAKVEDKLRSFDASRGGRGAGAWGRGGRGGSGGRGNGFARGGGGGDWSRDGPRDHNSTGNSGREAPLQKSYQVSREKQRAMSGTWERGLDPATAALEDDAPPQHSEGRGRIGSGGAGG
ncbi:unnamed protein product, partial [Scytosiphon promiscuus]